MNDNFHLKGLNGLRAIAAITVVIGHIELIKSENGLDNVFLEIQNWGSLGVNLFFVLSGFLITTLLLREKNTKQTIHLKNFYIRRILRIWPLYFIILISSATIFGYTPSWLTLLLCSTIFPNIAHALSIGWAVSPHIWSIGVEEQFYLFWPKILKQKTSLIIAICLLFIFFYPILPVVLQYIMIRTGFSAQTMSLTEKIFNVLNFNAMATGALFSILYFQKNTLILKVISFSKNINFLFVLLPFVFWFGNINFGFIQISVYSFLFAWMIVLIVSGTLTVLFEGRVLRFLGKISYGIYMYHWIILLLTMEYLQPYFESSPSIANSLLYVIVISLTILIAHLSFEFIEKRILKFKSRFS
jgi:peptidoglycan/LPS O-acetylase OafA/YrhL